MAISPISDIVLEVAKAADPASYSAAAGRLSRLAGSAAAVPAMPGTDAPAQESFADALGTAATPRPPVAPHLPFDPALALVRMQNKDALAAGAGSPFQQYEGFILSSFVETMLPKDSEILYGAGTAGEIWKSMLAEGLGSHLSRVGGFGIADMLAASLREDEPEAAVAEAPAEMSHAPVCS
jgi:peptidoglycan hydrolase FlgJ